MLGVNYQMNKIISVSFAVVTFVTDCIVKMCAINKGLLRLQKEIIAIFCRFVMDIF